MVEGPTSRGQEKVFGWEGFEMKMEMEMKNEKRRRARASRTWLACVACVELSGTCRIGQAGSEAPTPERLH